MSIVPPGADSILTLALYPPNSAGALVPQWRSRGILYAWNVPIGGIVLRALCGGNPHTEEAARQIVANVLVTFLGMKPSKVTGVSTIRHLTALGLLYGGRVQTGALRRTVADLIRLSKEYERHSNPETVAAFRAQHLSGWGTPSTPAPGAVADEPPPVVEPPEQQLVYTQVEKPQNGVPKRPVGIREPSEQALRGVPVHDLFVLQEWLRTVVYQTLQSGGLLDQMEEAGIDALSIVTALRGGACLRFPHADRYRALVPMCETLYDDPRHGHHLARRLYSFLRSGFLISNGYLQEDRLHLVLRRLAAHEHCANVAAN